ncbi:MAG: UDP-N-acetylglucosamine 2-epimerase (non-hydrolyzing) [Planctomycetota bacterium]
MNICGARPNFMKIAPLMRAYQAYPQLAPILVHTGQHYDENMSELFFRQLEIPEPRINLEVGSGSHARQTAEIMTRFEPLLLEQRPEWVVVVGDVNSTLACGLVAAKLGIKLAHVEAGLRSFDRTMPEEINRQLTDAISDLLFVSEPSGLANLKREGVPDEQVHYVGNVMIDTLKANLVHAERSPILEQLGLVPGGYNVVTLHRPSNVDDPGAFERLIAALERIQRDLPTVFPMHPRTRHSLERAGLHQRLSQLSGLRVIEPLGYLDFLRLISRAAVVLTDSGGIQEETTILGVWCLTIRENTERPITVEQGTNHIVGSDPEKIVSTYEHCRRTPVGERVMPEMWDGHAAARIAEILAARCGG